jgi:hypothetical protein
MPAPALPALCHGLKTAAPNDWQGSFNAGQKWRQRISPFFWRVAGIRPRGFDEQPSVMPYQTPAV